MRERWGIAALLSGLAVWAAVTHPWFAPGFAALAGARIVLLLWFPRVRAGHHVFGPGVAFIGLSYVGLAYLVAVQLGTPLTARFWLIFFVGVAILGPVVILAARMFRR